MIEARGAPRDQGCAQGEALGGPIRDLARSLRKELGWGRRRRSAWRAAARVGRALACHLPQQHERLQGIGAAASVRPGALVLVETLRRVAMCDGMAQPAGGAAAASAPRARLQAALALPSTLAPALFARSCEPDAGGFPSLELTCAPFSGCLAGVNAEGIGVLCLEDPCGSAPSVRFLAQDVLLRARTREGALEHLRRRAGYIGSSGALLLAHASSDAVRVALHEGVVSVADPGPAAGAAQDVRIDPAAGVLAWRDAQGAERRERLR